MSSPSIRITLDNGEILEWQVLSDPASILWYKLFSKESLKSDEFYFRYSGLNHSRSNLNYFISSMNSILEIIRPHFKFDQKLVLEGEITREELNQLHHIFEGNYGSINEETEQYKNASEDVKAALCALNHLIHDYETWQKCSTGISQFFSIIGELPDAKKLPLPEMFETQFTLDPIPGSIVLHYGVVGKQWHEVFVDGDEVIPEEAIVPLKMISGEFDLFFADHILDSNQLADFDAFLKEKANGISRDELNIGVLPVAIPKKERTLNEWRVLFSENKIAEISIDGADGEKRVILADPNYESPFTSLLKLPPIEE